MTWTKSLGSLVSFVPASHPICPLSRNLPRICGKCLGISSLYHLRSGTNRVSWHKRYGTSSEMQTRFHALGSRHMQASVVSVPLPYLIDSENRWDAIRSPFSPFPNPATPSAKP